MSQHTAGPWTAEPFGIIRSNSSGVDYARGSERVPVAMVVGNPVLWAEVAANSKLIAAAPELLAALQRAVCWTVAAGLGLDDDAPVMPEWRADADAAIAKARGTL